MRADQGNNATVSISGLKAATPIFLLIVIGLTPGCTPGSLMETRQLEREDADILSLPVGRRVAIAQGQDTNEIVCLAPSPDYAQATGFTLARPGASAGESSSDLALGGRSSNVLIAREVLYMTCSMVAHHARSSEEAKEIFYKGLSAVTDIADNDTLQGSHIGTASASTNITELSTTETNRDSSNKNTDTDATGGW